jgi:type IX secretion system PorP/SprF family membrane protein
MMKFRQTVLIALAVLGIGTSAEAQDVHFTQFNFSPLTINPAFTGMHNGLWRASGIYRNQWNSVTTPYVTTGISFDAPIYRGVGSNTYLSGGVNFFTDKSGDGNLMNNTIIGSLAYHKSFGETDNMSISLGMQGGYVQKSIDLSRLYFADEFKNGGYNLRTTQELLNNRINSYVANVGVNWGHAPSEKFAYQIGAAAYNINQPLESFQKQTPNNEVGLGMRINTQLGIVWHANDRFSVLPAVLYQTQTNASELIAGTELKYRLGEEDVRSVASSLFLGGWTRTGDATLVTGGIEMKGFRVGVGYDLTSSKLKTAASGVGGFELGVQYIQPNPIDFARKVFFPCARF